MDTMSSPTRATATSGHHSDDNMYLSELRAHPELSGLIEDYTYTFSSAPQALNDSSSEYIVQTMKHFFDKIIVVQYSITNTLEDQILSQVKLVISNIDSSS